MSRALLIDAGNSRIKWAIVDTRNASALEMSAWIRSTSDNAEPERTESDKGRRNGPATLAAGAYEHGNEAAEHALLSAAPIPARAVISNVAGADVAARIGALVERTWPGLVCEWVRSLEQQHGVTNGYRTPSELGTDRWCGMIGAHAAYPGEHLLIATLGTATTVEALRDDGFFAGGLIAPGWTLMMESLGQRTAQLPSLDTAQATRELRAMGATEHNRDAFACDTRTSLSEGSRAAQAAFVEYAWREAQALFGGSVRCILGGGAAKAIGDALRIPFTRHDGLVLAGLALIARELDPTR
ncbi:MAG TPA: type III pantothenate kinase [Pararobbsia sp.]|nr:type III pantothenate kinase [Pararobbsia sp.]